MDFSKSFAGEVHEKVENLAMIVLFTDKTDIYDCFLGSLYGDQAPYCWDLTKKNFRGL